MVRCRRELEPESGRSPAGLPDRGGRMGCEMRGMTRPRVLCLAAFLGGLLALLTTCAHQGQFALPPLGGTAAPADSALSLLATSAPLPTLEPPVAPSRQAPTPVAPITQVRPPANLAIEAISGEPGTYTLTLLNQGPGPATGIVITDVLPSGVSRVWVQPDGPLCRWREGDVGCDLGDVQPGDAATVTLDLAVTGAGAPKVTTHRAGASLDLVWPSCEVDQNATPPSVRCYLDSLLPGAEARVRVGFAAGRPLGETLIHTTTVKAEEAGPDSWRNRSVFTTTAAPAGPLPVSTPPAGADLVLGADGPSIVHLGQPFTYTYAITNQGGSPATGVWFEDTVPSDLDLVAFAPGPPRCEQAGDTFTCFLSPLDSPKTVTFTLAVTGYGDQSLNLELDPLRPGWPACFVVKERTWQHVVHCEIGTLRPGQAVHVQLGLVAIGTRERATSNTASVTAGVQDMNPADNTHTTAITIQAGGQPGQD